MIPIFLSGNGWQIFWQGFPLLSFHSSLAYPSIRQLFQESLIHIIRIYYHEYHMTAIIYGFMGILSNLAATLITYPIQTLRTRIQARVDSRSLPSSSSPSLPSSFDVFWHYYKGFKYKLLSVILHGFIFYYMQKVLSNMVAIWILLVTCFFCRFLASFDINRSCFFHLVTMIWKCKEYNWFTISISLK